jgi:hypothetical protein
MKTTSRHTPRRADAALHRSRPAAAVQPPHAGHPEHCWTALLEAGGDGQPCIRNGEAFTRVRTAASCLLAPIAGDTVLCFGAAPDDVWVLGVLERCAGAQERLLQCSGDTRFVVEGGRLALEAEQLQMKSARLELRADTAAVSIDAAEYVGERVRLIAGTVKLVGSVLSTVMDRVNHFSQHYLRTTRGLDRVSADHIECDAAQLLHLRGEHALINGAKLVKTRGAQIHFG